MIRRPARRSPRSPAPGRRHTLRPRSRPARGNRRAGAGSHPRSPVLSSVDLHHLARRRAAWTAGIILVLLAGLLGRLGYLQGVQAGHLQRLALVQQLETLVLPPSRGRIFDRAGRPLATNVQVESVYAIPRGIRDPRAFAARVAPILGMDARAIERRLEPHLYFVWLRRKVTPQVADAVRALGLEGQIGFLREERRAYPHGPLAAHLLGFVGIDNQGLGGVELAYEEVLRGRAGKTVVERDAVGRPLVETARLTTVRVDGADLVLTVDQVLQHVVEIGLERALEETRAVRGMVVVLDPRTGEVLAMAARPAFDPGAFARVPPERWFNRPISEVFEPGSTFKVVTVAAALDTGRADLDDLFGCPQFLTVGKHRIRDAHRYCRTTQTLDDIVRHSSNVGAAQVATRLGKPLFYDYIRRFGFGAPTRIDLPGEGTGIVNPPGEWRGPGLQTIAFGQGVSGTALQLLSAASALANDGVLMRPQVVRMVRDREGRVVRGVGPEPVRRVVKAETARTLMRMMVRVVEDGTGTQARVPGYVVAGKTGTAQKPGPAGGYVPGKFVSSFFGFVPVPNPRLAILVVLDEPVGAYYGGAVAAPVFREIASRALWYLRIPPTAPLSLSAGTPTPRPR